MTLPAVLPVECDLAPVGLRREEVSKVELLHRRKINWIFRVWCGERSWILKWVMAPEKSRELAFYQLLEACGVAVLPHRRGERVLLLEDLEHSAQWRLAKEADASKGDTGLAVAQWYRKLHAAGRRLVKQADVRLAELEWEYDALTPPAMRSTGERMGLSGERGWQLAEACLEELVAAARRLPMTLNYNDFHWSNVALAREHIGEVRGIVFDYHLAGVGLAYSDWRNVLSCLQGPAAEAFSEAYGPVDESEAVLDRPLALVHAVQMACESPARPTWADMLLNQVRSGLLERFVQEARRHIR